jgi:peptide/nickel transport system permease protein
MFNYLIRRLAFAVLTLVVITCIVYALIRHMPGTPLTMDMAEQSLDKRMTEQELKQLERIYGLDKPWYVAYVHWLGNVAHFDFGRSFKDNKHVSRKIGQRIGPTFLLSGTSLFLAYLLSVPIGLYSAQRSGRPDERIVSTVLYMLYAVPTFVAGLLLLVLFYKQLAGTLFYLEPGMKSENYDRLESSWQQCWDITRHMILPVICFTYGSLAYYSRFIKSNMEEVVRQDYIRTARAKGVGSFRILVHHAFRNTMIPFVTMIGLTLPALVGGSIVIEQVFSWPGIGTLYLASILQRDYPVIMGLTLMFSVLTLAGQLLADILYAVVDPRITYT